MKKLLFMGALLIVGATAFGAVSATLVDSSGSSTGKTDLSGEATLRLTSRGNVLDPTDKAILVVTPTVNAGPDGESLSFDFADMVIGQPQTLVGKFTSKIVTATSSLPDTISMKELPFDSGNNKATLTTTLEPTVAAEGTTSGDTTLSGIPLLDTGDSAEIGDLTYQISTLKTNSTTYTTEVIATANPTGEGSFLNKGAKVTVKVEKFSYTK